MKTGNGNKKRFLKPNRPLIILIIYYKSLTKRSLDASSCKIDIFAHHIGI